MTKTWPPEVYAQEVRLALKIPPSIMFIVYDPGTWISVGKLFMAVFGPGLMLSVLYMIYIAFRCFLQPAIAPFVNVEELLASLEVT